LVKFINQYNFLFFYLLFISFNYKSKSKSYILSSNDRNEILENISKQEWFQKSKHPSIINSILITLEVENDEYITNNLETKFKLRLKFTDFTFNVNYHRNNSFLKYFVFFENSKLKGHVCYIDSTLTEDQQNIKLPEYDLIQSIINKRMIDKFDILHITAELIMYYDEKEEVRNAHIGIKYPISLVYLANQIK
jgi:hypothetical protein